MGCWLSSNSPEEVEVIAKPIGTDKALLQIKIARDQFSAKRKTYQRQIESVEQRVKELAKENKKEQAIYFLAKRKELKETLKGADSRLNLLNDQIRKMEQTMDDVELTATIQQSNQVLKELMQKVDIDALREAKALDEEFNAQNEEVSEALKQAMEDETLLEEFENLGGVSEPKKVAEKEKEEAPAAAVRKASEKDEEEAQLA